jgi:hypothetical protein
MLGDRLRLATSLDAALDAAKHSECRVRLIELDRLLDQPASCAVVAAGDRVLVV